MRAKIALILLVCATGITLFGTNLFANRTVHRDVEWNLEALYNGQGEFVGCWPRPNDCKKLPL